MTRSMRAVAAATILAFCAGCFGTFGLSRSLWHWNDKTTDSKALKELLFFALCIVPVYELSALADVLIFNSIEFWSGKNPITAMKDGDRDIIVQRTGRGLQIEVVEPGKAPRAVEISIAQDGAEARDGAGVLLASVRADETGVTVADGAGRIVLHRTPGEAEALASAVHASPAAFVRLLEQQEAGALVAAAR